MLKQLREARDELEILNFEIEQLIPQVEDTKTYEELENLIHTTTYLSDGMEHIKVFK